MVDMATQDAATETERETQRMWRVGGGDGSGKSSIGESFSRARQSRFGSTKKGEEWKERRRCDSADEKLLSLLSFLMQVLI